MEQVDIFKSEGFLCGMGTMVESKCLFRREFFSICNNPCGVLALGRAVGLSGFLLLQVIISGGIQAQTAREWVERSEQHMRGASSEVTLLIRTVRPSWTREMRVKAWQKGNEFSMILVEAPSRDKGIVFLKRGKEVWNWIPSIEKVIKLPPSMMSQSWMGTDFSNDDLVRESSILRDYQHRIMGDTLIQGRDCVLINMDPLPEAPVVWGRLVVAIDRKDLIQLHVRFYDEEGALVNIMNGFDVKLLGGRSLPSRFEMIPMDKKNQRTEMVYEKVVFDRPIVEAFFTPDNMRNLR